MILHISLCLNCLEEGANHFEIGPDKGSQRDPYRTTLDLCDDCKEALENGEFAKLADRNRRTRTIKRP